MRLVITFLFVLVTSCFAFSQDNPLLDTPVPRHLPERILGPGIPAVAVITTLDGFDNFDLGTTNAEPHMASNPLNPLWYFNAFNTNSAFRTTDGLTWFGSSPNFNAVVRGDPVIAYDSVGNLYYETMYGSPNILGCRVIRSTDNGATWTAAVTSIAGIDKNWIACDQTAGPYANYVYTTMTAGSGVGNFARSTDFGETWTNTATFNTQTLPGMMVAVGPNVMGENDIPGGCVYVVTHSGSNGAGTYTFYRSTNGGVNFSFMSNQQFSGYIGLEVGGRSTVEGMRTRPYPMIAADNSYGPYRGRLYLVYATNDPAGNGNKADIFLHYSTDQGATWSSRRRVNDDPNTQNNHNFFPAIWCEKSTGRLYIKWYDSRLVPTSDSTDVYATYTDDGGETFAPNQRLTNRTFKIRVSTATPPAYQGDYDAITSNPFVSGAVWTDFRNGNYLGMFSYLPDFAMKVSPLSDTLGLGDSTTVTISVPAVKLYTYPVRFSASVSPPADFVFMFPNGDSLTSYPDSLQMTILPNNVPAGAYTVSITGAGPNGTPVHRRSVTLLMTAPFTTVTQPNGGERVYAGTPYEVRWNTFMVDTVNIAYSTDGGSTWISIEDSVSGPSTAAHHPKTGLISNPSSDPGSYLWSVPHTPSTNCLIRVSATSNSSIFDISNAPFTILAFPAPQWRAQSAGTAINLYAVSVVDTSTAFVAGDSGKVYRTANGGSTWSLRGSFVDPVSSIFATDVSRALVAINASNDARILRTVNGGLSWQTVFRDTLPGAFINHVKMFDLENGYAIGDPVNGFWTLLRTTDGGVTWTRQDSLAQTGGEFGLNNSGYWVGSQHGWFGTNDNRIYRTTNGGSTWTSATTAIATSYGVAFATTGIGMAAGESVETTTDGGETWSPTTGQVPGTAFSVAVVNTEPRRWFLTSGSDVYRSTNDGGVFTLDAMGPFTYWAIDMKTVSVGSYTWVTGYAAGNQGTLTKYMELLGTTDATESESEIPTTLALSQNYPNPFNPSTVIRYSLPVGGIATLKVYNVLGQEVATLVDGEMNAGRHEVTWDASENPSGVYFYRLQSEGLTAMKKLLLLK
jgi:photosystem II stability/assembly factor-like uncharacterized protein